MNKCSVCGASGVLIDAHIYVTNEPDQAILFIGQCPVCERFICSRHGERLDLNQREYRFRIGFGRCTEASQILCCPFDPGVALGKSSE